MYSKYKQHNLSFVRKNIVEMATMTILRRNIKLNCTKPTETGFVGRMVVPQRHSQHNIVTRKKTNNYAVYYRQCICDYARVYFESIEVVCHRMHSLCLVMHHRSLWHNQSPQGQTFIQNWHIHSHRNVDMHVSNDCGQPATNTATSR